MKRKLITGLVLGLLVFGVQMSFLVDSFPGFHSNGDCNVCHNYPATAYNSSLGTSDVNVDGLADDAMWQEDNAYGRTAYIPVASRFGGAHWFIKMTFGQNDTHFFMMVSWEDPTINGADEDRTDTDGFSVVFNINNSDFDTGYGMDLAGDGMVDIVTWRPTAAATGTEESINDYTPIDVDGWVADENIADVDDRNEDTNNEWTVGAVHGNVSSHNENNYQLEFARPLTTADTTEDVQFDVSKYYEFGIVVFNDTSNSGHFISPVYEVFVYSASDTTAPIATVVDYITVPTTIQGDDVTVVQTEKVTVTQESSEGKSPISFLPVVLALFAIPVVVLVRRR